MGTLSKPPDHRLTTYTDSMLVLTTRAITLVIILSDLSHPKVSTADGARS